MTSHIFSAPEVEEVLLRLLHHTVCVRGQFQFVSHMYTEELKTFHPLHSCPVDVYRGVLLTEVHDHLFFADIE